jgi:hypothetical protein
MHEVCWKVVLSRPTPIWGGVNGMVVNKKFKVSNLLLTTNYGVTTCSIITSTRIVKVATNKGMIFKHAPPLIGLMGLVVTASRSLCSNTKINDVAHVALILVPICKDTKEGCSYLKFGKMVW